jgi:hypothetical protein
MYSWMFNKTYPQHPRFHPALLAIRHAQANKGKETTLLFNKELNLPIDHTAMHDTLLQVEEKLRHLLEELFDPTVSFSQTTVAEHCKYCDFKNICGR